MTALTQTPGNVRSTISTVARNVQVGEAVSAGMPGYRNTTDNKYYKAVSSSAAASAAECMFLMNGSINGYAFAAFGGGVNPGATVVIGETYYVDSVAGQIVPSVDIGAGEFVCSIGTADSTSNIPLVFNPVGVAHA